MRESQIASMRGYKHHPGFRCGLPSAVATNTLNREFEFNAPNKVWATDFTYIRIIAKVSRSDRIAQKHKTPSRSSAWGLCI